MFDRARRGRQCLPAQVRACKKQPDGLSVVVRKGDGRFAHAFDLVGAGLRERRKRGPQFGRKRERSVSQAFHAMAVEGHGNGVCAVEAGAGHESDRNAFGHGIPF